LIPREVRHSIQAYRFLRTHDLLIISGGGQLDEEWGGPWGHPFALFKWAVLARMARVPCAVASVGACKMKSRISRRFLSAAFCMACYRSYRDEKSRRIAAGLLQRAAKDSVVPDLAFSIPASELPPPAPIRSMSQGRTVIALSPIAYAKPENWPSEDRAVYDRYVQHMAQVLSLLLGRGYSLVIVCSSLGDDDHVIPEILDHLDDDAKKKVPGRIHIPAITTWKDFVASLRDVDILIASRLHSVILGFVTSRPTIAVSFDPKVDWVMEDLGQTDYLLQIRDFSAGDLVETLERIQLHKTTAAEHITSYQRRILPICKLQYDALAELALARLDLHN
jgi:polysaccharide pyruvyl transferase WcaK-like protein